LIELRADALLAAGVQAQRNDYDSPWASLVIGAVVLAGFLLYSLMSPSSGKTRVFGSSQKLKATRPLREPDHRTRVRRFPFAGFPCLGKPVTGDEGSVEALVRARRFREASALVSPGDLEGRVGLAVARLGPATDLLRAVHTRRRVKGRHRARSLLASFYPNLAIRFAAFYSTVAYDPVENRCALLELRIRKGRFRKAAVGYEKLAQKYPKADEAPAWIMNSALAFGLARQTDDARRMALRATGLSDGHPEKDSASRFLRRFDHAKGKASTTRHRRSGRLAYAIERSQKRKHLPEYPRWPNQIERLGWIKSETELVDLTTGNVIAVLKAGAMPLVALSNGPQVFLRAVGAIAPDIGAVSLDDGSVITWDDLLMRSIWGERMFVVRSKRTARTWVAIPPDQAFMGPPLGDDRSRAHDERSLAVLRAQAQRSPDDPMVAHALLWCLYHTPVEDDERAARVQEILGAAAVARARFGQYIWVRFYWALVVDQYSNDPNIKTLAVLDSQGRTAPTAILERALAHARPQHKDHHLREAAFLDATHGPTYGMLLEQAERRGDADEYDSLFRYTQKTFPKDSEAPLYFRTLQVIRHGPRGAFPLLANQAGESPEVVAQARAALAAHSADPDLLDTVEQELVAVKPDDPRIGLCRVYAALHRADAATAVAQLEEALKRDGVFNQSILALLDIATGLVPSSQGGAVLKRAEPYMAASPEPFRTLVVESRTTQLWQDGLELGRRMVEAGVLPGWGNITQVEGILQAIDKVIPEERGALIEEGFRLLGGIPDGEWGPLPTFMEVALEIHRDPDRAWTLLQDAKVESVPLISFALAAEIAARKGDTGRVESFRSRMANPDLIVQGMTIASRLGLVRAVEGAIANLDPDLFPHAVYDLYAAGGTVPRLPSVPTPDYPRITIELLDRLARNGAWAHLTHLAAVRFRAGSLLRFEDGALGASLCALARAGEGDTSELEQLAQRSRHPAVLRALMVAEDAGIGFKGSREWATKHAPGMVEALDRARRTS